MGSSVPSAAPAKAPADPLAGYVRLTQIQGALSGRTYTSSVLVGFIMNNMNTPLKDVSKMNDQSQPSTSVVESKNNVTTPLNDVKLKPQSRSSASVVGTIMNNHNTQLNDAAKLNEQPEPSTSGLGSGQSASRKDSVTKLPTRNILKAKRKTGAIAAERKEIDELARRAKFSLCIYSIAEEQADAKTDSALMRKLKNAVSSILHVANASKLINVTCRRALKVAATSITDVGEVLISRTSKEQPTVTTPVTKLQGEIAKLGNSLERPKSPIASCSYSEPPPASQGVYSHGSKMHLQQKFDIAHFHSADKNDLRIWKMVGMTKEDVIAAVARKGECPLELVICSDLIKYGKQGQEMDSVFVTLPSAVAKKVAEGQHLNIGWFSVPVKILPPKPVRCAMCMEAGHNRASCVANVDCTNQCFRCSKFGHRSVECTAPPLCTLCAEAGKPTQHAVGDRACTAPSEIKWNR